MGALQQAPRHSTSSQQNMPSARTTRIGPTTRSSTAFMQSDPCNMHGVVPHIWMKCLPTGSRLNIE